MQLFHVRYSIHLNHRSLFFDIHLHIMYINICMQYDINIFGLLFLRPVQRDILLNRDKSYTLSRINEGRRVSPQSLYSKKNDEFLHKQTKHISLWIELVSSYILHSALCTNRFVW